MLFVCVVAVASAVSVAAVGCRSRGGPADGEGAAGAGRSAESAPLHESRGDIFGTTYAVKVVGGELSGPALDTAVREALEAVDDTMSTYDPESDLSRFNAAPLGTSVSMDPLVFEVLALSAKVVEESDGAFDPTVGPLVRAWGFGPDEATAKAPDVAALRDQVGWDKLEIDADGHTLTKAHAGQELDLSAVAKGYAVDRVAMALEAAGSERYMVEVGGEVRAAGLSPQGRPWRIGIERPDPSTRALHAAVELRDRAMATSGDYRNYREVEGRRVSHTIDPRTGRPIEHGLASVTVLADTCAEADAWATALNVLGPDAGLATARRVGLDAYLIVRSGSGFEVRATPDFPLVDASGG